MKWLTVIFVAVFLAASVAPSEPVYAKNSYKQHKPKKHRVKKYRPKNAHSNTRSRRHRSRNKQQVSPFESCDSYGGCVSRRSHQGGNSRRLISDPSFSVSY